MRRTLGGIKAEAALATANSPTRRKSWRRVKCAAPPRELSGTFIFIVADQFNSIDESTLMLGQGPLPPENEERKVRD